ncbi:hypothetical protein [Lentilactobacillus hilgardii]|uniref:hypothetical protein n=1 Tax=Lentilactobacillus hilgardii TaxID=1588 RepID=UPI0021A31E2D|nr:hypothetical protein [Lentilactobacillus hilgardii]MCT3400174.1 hypothetical protein [Lentilactobacillus hilgardii]
MDLKKQEVKIKQLQEQVKKQQEKIENRLGKEIIKKFHLEYANLDNAKKTRLFVKNLKVNDSTNFENGLNSSVVNQDMKSQDTFHQD